MLLSHPDKLLKEHLKNVSLIGDSILLQKRINFKSFSNDKIRQLNRINLLTHDIGKATSYFQDYIKNVNGKQNNDEKKSHGLLSGVLSFKIASTVLKDEALAFFHIWWFLNTMENWTIFQILYPHCMEMKTIEIF
ncbi:MAG TPA: CRISPR-associated endonuclease Cas3'' [Acetivibrio clariflavus]|nr:CRISPR-associated endonuclease Cas3'' [Acetivibrio clariflavus]